MTELLCNFIEEAHIDPLTNCRTIKILDCVMEYIVDNNNFIWFNKPISVNTTYSVTKVEEEDDDNEKVKEVGSTVSYHSQTNKKQLNKSSISSISPKKKEENKISSIKKVRTLAREEAKKIEESAKISSLNDTKPNECASWSRPSTKETYNTIMKKQKKMALSQSLPTLEPLNNDKFNDSIYSDKSTVYDQEKNEMIKYIEKDNLQMIEFESDKILLNYCLLENEATNDKEFINPIEILYIPDFFQPISVLKQKLHQLVVECPNCNILIPSLPGYAYTVYNKHELNNKYESDILHKLINELIDRKIWGYKNCLRLICGQGNGANILLYWILKILYNDKNLLNFEKSIKLCLLTNPFCSIGDDLKESLNNIIKITKNPSITERYHNLINIIYSKDYLNIHTVDKTTEEFARMCFNWMKSTNTDCIDESSLPLIKGALKHEDLEESLAGIHTPVYIIGSAGDLFINPSNSDKILHSIPDCKIVESVEDCINSTLNGKCIYSVWTNAGHDIILERNGFYISELKSIVDVYDDMYEELIGFEKDDLYSAAILGEDKSNPLKHYHAKKYKIRPDLHRGKGDFDKYSEYDYGKNNETEKEEKEEKVIDNIDKSKRRKRQEEIDNLTNITIEYEGISEDELIKTIDRQIDQLYKLGGDLSLRFELKKRGIFYGGKGDTLKRRLKDVILDEIARKKLENIKNESLEEHRKKQEEIRRLRVLFEKYELNKQESLLMQEEIRKNKERNDLMIEKKRMYEERRLMVKADREMSHIIKVEKENQRWKVVYNIYILLAS